MDLNRMLEKCRRDQWKLSDLDWTLTPRALPPEHEEAVVQYFTNMAGIERLAGKLFEVQRDRATHPTLRAIFETFVVDEVRHSAAAERLAAHYNVRKLRQYEQHPNLQRFSEYFVGACRYLAPDIANSYITAGELLLDIALLRSLDDFVNDEMSKRAMVLINRDESRHIAVDYYMTEYYGSPEYERDLSVEKRSLREQAVAAKMFAGMLFHARPFFQQVFFRPMDLVDPSGVRLKEAFKRMQLLGRKQGVADRPFTKFMQTLQAGFQHPVIGKFFGPLIERIMGVDGRVIQQLYTEDELRRSQAMSIAEMAEEALQAKTLN